jgi:hypothetical protein
MNGDGQNPDQGGSVDGQDITPNTVTTNTITATTLNTDDINVLNGITTTTVTATTVNTVDANVTGLLTVTDVDVLNGITATRIGATDGVFEDLAFITGRCVPSVLAPPLYILPITAPPNDSNTYSICNVPNPSTLTTPATNASFTVELIQGANATVITIDFLPVTSLDSSFVYSQINNAIANWFTSNGSPSYITLSLNTSAFPYRTNVNVVGASAGIAIDVNGTTGMAPLLGYTVTTPFYGTGVTPSPFVTAFSLLSSAIQQLTWSSLDSSDSLISTIPFEIQSGTGTSSITCTDMAITAEVEGINRIIVDQDNTRMYSKRFPASAGSGVTVFDSGDIEIATYNGLLGSFNVFTADPKVNITGPGGQSQVNLFTDTIDIYNTNGAFATTLREQITPVQQQFMSPDTSTQLTISNTGVRVSNAYNLPNTDGSNGQVMTTDGAGQSSWQTPRDNSKYSITTSTTYNSSTTETSLIGAGQGSTVLSIGSFPVGASYALNIYGTVRTSGPGQTIRFRLKSTSGTIADTGLFSLTNLGTPVTFTLTTQFTYTGGTSCTGSISFNWNGSATNMITSTLGTFNSAIAQTISLTAQWSNASANNSIISTIGTLTRVY